MHPTNEDTLIAVDDIVERFMFAPAFAQYAPLTGIFAVFDGHGGRGCSQYLKDHLTRAIVTNENFESIDMPSEEALILCVEDALLNMEEGFCRIARKKPDRSGACACVVVVRGSMLCAANVGDCQAILVEHDGNVVQLSRPHRATDPAEVARIEAKGGTVINGRVMGALEPSRSIGDIDLKSGLAPAVIPTPHVTTRSLPYRRGQGPSVLVVASDGVWDTLAVQAVVDIVRTETDLMDPKKMRLAARRLVRRAREAGSTDDVTCVVAFLR
ncbi:unnamed protein product [Phaeothamnion confervicola]